MARLKPQEPQSPPPSPDETADRTAAGYIEYPGGSRCGTCEYSSDRAGAQAMCTKWNFSISNSDGCCNDWQSFDGKGIDYVRDEGSEQKTSEAETPNESAT